MELFAADGHDAGGCERVTGKSGMRPCEAFAFASTTPSPARWKNQIIAGLYTTDPPLALSHLRLRRVPPTAINVHRHIHAAKAPRRRQFNVSVERTDYARVGLTWVLERVRHMNA